MKTIFKKIQILTSLIFGIFLSVSSCTDFPDTNGQFLAFLDMLNNNNNAAPSGLSYPGNPYTFSNSVTLSGIIPVYSGSITSCTSATTLPTGLTLSQTSCEIQGTPIVDTPFAVYQITASNDIGSVTVDVGIVVNNLAPTNINYGGPYIFTRGVAIPSFAPSMTGTSNSFAVTAGTLPAGLLLDGTTGVISGTPTAVTASSVITITATNGGGSGTGNVTITVNDAPPSALNYGGNPYVFTVNAGITPIAPTITGTPTLYSISPALPTGLVFDTATGGISGTPTAITAAASYLITASNSGGSTSFLLTLTVNDVAPTFTYAGPLTFTKLVAVATPVTPTGVTGTPTYSVSPDLPAGLVLDTATGGISGTPLDTSAAADYTITATNSGGSASQTVSIAVNNLAPAGITYAASTFTNNMTITPLSPSAGTGGVPASYALQTGTLPPGMALNAVTGVISGTPAVPIASTFPAAYPVTVRATNTGGFIDIAATVTISEGAPTNFSYSPAAFVLDIGKAMTSVPSIITGSATYSAVLPAGLAVNSTTGAISGTPSGTVSSGYYTITATNTGGSVTTQVYFDVQNGPVVVSTTPAESTTVSISGLTTLAVAFSRSMDLTTISVNTTDNSCTGSIQISSNNFTTCYRMTGFTASPDNSVFTLNLHVNNPLFAGLPNVRFKVLTSVKDVTFGTNLALQYDQLNGFATAGPLRHYNFTGGSLNDVVSGANPLSPAGA
ncbi:MAG: putative Ig domain-containing protein, partial [Spirochaetia bacterium]|nr:putative Ig domain-containing protein [Spirochaetia bacterium]